MFSNFALLDLGTPELVIILAIVLLLFGGKKLPELSKSVGESLKEIRKAASATTDLKNDVKSEVAKTKESLAAKQHEV